MVSPAGPVTIAPRETGARHAVAVRDGRRGPRRGLGSGGALVAPRNARVAGRAQRAVPGAVRGAGRGAHRPGEPAVAAGRGAVARARRRGAPARRRLSLPAGGRRLRGPAALAAAGAARRGGCRKGRLHHILHRAGGDRGCQAGLHVRLAPGPLAERRSTAAARHERAVRRPDRSPQPAPDPCGASCCWRRPRGRRPCSSARGCTGSRCWRRTPAAHRPSGPMPARLISRAETAWTAPSLRCRARRSPSTTCRPCRRSDRASSPGRDRAPSSI